MLIVRTSCYRNHSIENAVEKLSKVSVCHSSFWPKMAETSDVSSHYTETVEFKSQRIVELKEKSQ